MHIYHYTVVIEPNDEGGYTVTCPALPGVVTEGDTIDEARIMAEDAIRCYIESIQKDGLPVPVEQEIISEPIRERVAIALKTA